MRTAGLISALFFSAAGLENGLKNGLEDTQCP